MSMGSTTSTPCGSVTFCLLRALRALKDFVYEKVRGILSPPDIQSFEDYAVTNFGRALAEFNMLNYTQKIWGIPCTEISKDWALQRIGGLSVLTTLRKLLFKRGGPKTLADTFYYPELGSGTIYRAIAERIRKNGSEILTSSEPVKIRHADGAVTGVDIKTAGGIRSFSPDTIACSIPVTQAVALFDPPAPAEVLAAAAKLRFRSQVYLFLTIDRERVSHDNWVYFPNLDIPFGRFSEMKNFSTKMSPPGKTSLFVEYFCFEGDAIWVMEKDALFDLTIKYLDQLGFLKREEVSSVHHFRQRHVYPIYDLHYKHHLQTVMHWLDGFTNFYAIGRPGRFRYTNQDHSLEMGILAARSIIDGKRYDIENVGVENEYFERGYVPEKR
jgi:protoporphyrinogen oxidase